MNNTLLKKCIAEAIGTFVLVFVACGVAAITGDLVATALAFGLVIVAMAYSIGNISGCHINPAVSLGCFLTKRMTAKEFGLYVLSQVIGGLLGGVLLFGILKMANVDVKENVGDACNYAVNWAGDLTFGKVMASLLVEIVLTFIFVYVILNVTDGKNGVTKKAGLIIGLTLTLVHLVGIDLTGTSVNPARSLATALTAAMFKGDADALKQVWMFIIAPLAGGALAAVVYPLLHKDDEPVEKTKEVETKEVETKEENN